MSKLEVLENKKLVLKKVICKQLKSLQVEKLEQEIDKFYQHLKLLNVQMFGPLIVKNSGTMIHEDGTITVDYDLYVQAHDFRQYDTFYTVYEEVICPHCVYVRFEDRPEYLQFAYSKLDLHFYENDLETDGTSYTVYVNTTGEMMTVDIFRPIVSL
ncbi:AraC family transcriptional regulator [Streptococcus ruminantium]|uniref:AraC family transcriptional regulator n=1 Tax=Streptococcus ruminantium TaxID=1917441 RepID=A0ABU1B3R1_9STRE|nr:AraC family transcriptional regulator [Streptococcus ruminantium]MDQ8759684.1 AraC family transcriptional regulator [Streptococcus ruminantium]MDQ8765121.1 AraC family transcriptional regulator [Streptococcus ruminantium]MDQ8766679.1 AraC family transcriptional regulator [Streptococcus ruminantium]MDQ8769161.1 AraC family transcriptional regulator [Streptococcus ruminantium]MDQ8774558.1 AraC family transcriptional regulator [Streptococcus ruminantium]